MKKTIKLSFFIISLFSLTLAKAQTALGEATATKLTVTAGKEGQTAAVKAISIAGPNEPANSNSAQDISWDFSVAGSSSIRAYRGNSWDTYMQFLTNSTTGNSPQVRMHINYDGNVGIGTTTPTSKLEVSGDTKINGNLIVTSNVGIGTTNPTAGLEIYKNLSASTLTISNSDPASFNTELRFGGNNTFEKSAIISAPNAAGWWRQDLYFCLANGNNSNSATISDAAMVIKSYNSGEFGYVGIGTTTPDEKLTVNGKIHATEIKVTATVPADYVFQKYYTGKSELKSDYVMPTLAEIESFTKKNNHLPNVPSAKEMQQKGMSLGEMSNVLLQKVEELTLYAIEQDKKSTLQQKEIERLKAENESYKSLAYRLTALENELKK